VRVLDLGCGDGQIAKALASTIRRPEIVLLDRDPEMLAQAVAALSECPLGPSVRGIHGLAETDGPFLARSVDVALLIHVAYLMEPSTLAQLVRSWPPRVPIVVVFDEVDSVFSRIWRFTAPAFADRVTKAHSLLNDLGSGYYVHRSSFETNVASPDQLSEKTRSLVLSMLSYSDYLQLDDSLQRRVVREIDYSTTDKSVACSCACYVVQRTA